MKPVTKVTIEMVGFNPIVSDKQALSDAVASAIESYEEEDGFKTFSNVSFSVTVEMEREK